MPLHRRLTWIVGFLLLAGSTYASDISHLSDSLRHALAHCKDSRQRIDLLINLKDLNEENELNLPVCIQLFREAAAVGDIYALNIAVAPIIVRYAPFTEKEDSLRYYLQTLRALVGGTPQEGMHTYAQMQIDFGRIRNTPNPHKRYQTAVELADDCRKALEDSTDIYHQVWRLTLLGAVNNNILRYEKKSKNPLIAQVPLWERAQELVGQMPAPNLRYLYGGIVYGLLSTAYIKASRYEDMEKLSKDYEKIIDDYFASELMTGRRPYLYTDNTYVYPYRRLIEGALKIGRKELAQEYFDALYQRLTATATGANLARNKSHLYQLGYTWKRDAEEFEQSLLYCDSLIRQIEQGESYYNYKNDKIKFAHRNKGILLYKLGRFDDAFNAFTRTFQVQNSLDKIDRANRLAAIIQTHEMELRQLGEMKAVIRNRIIGIISTVIIALLVTAIGIYYFVRLRRNQELRRAIARHSVKAQESEQMKSSFVNSICSELQTPFNAIDASTRGLISDSDAHRSQEYLQTVRTSTAQLLSTLDSMLEAANLDSLGSNSETTQVDINELCNTEISLALRRRQDDTLITYKVEASDAPCQIQTNAKDLSFVIRRLLENATGSLACGCVTIGYTCSKDLLRISVTAVGEGSEQRNLFWIEEADSRLSIARMIAQRLGGQIVSETLHNNDHRIVFTLSART